MTMGMRDANRRDWTDSVHNISGIGGTMFMRKFLTELRGIAARSEGEVQDYDMMQFGQRVMDSESLTESLIHAGFMAMGLGKPEFYLNDSTRTLRVSIYRPTVKRQERFDYLQGLFDKLKPVDLFIVYEYIMEPLDASR